MTKDSCALKGRILPLVIQQQSGFCGHRDCSGISFTSLNLKVGARCINSMGLAGHTSPNATLKRQSFPDPGFDTTLKVRHLTAVPGKHCGREGAASSGAANEYDLFAFGNLYTTSASKLTQGHVDGAGYPSSLPLRLLPHVHQDGLAGYHPLVGLSRCE